ncbi:MAG: hypothetical protein GY949_06375 [Gammaproteobacteria bacterium]|nr:hypothetical protein [Gammaproteobacteria bacterium]
MHDISLINPTIGLTTIDRREPIAESQNKETAYQPVGGKVVHSINNLYNQSSTRDRTLDLTVPQTLDSDLLQPQNFHAAFLDVCDKIAAHFEQDPAAGLANSHLDGLRKAYDQCSDNLVALNPV